MLESLNQEVVSVPVGWGRDLFMSVCVGGGGVKNFHLDLFRKYSPF